MKVFALNMNAMEQTEGYQVPFSLVVKNMVFVFTIKLHKLHFHLARGKGGCETAYVIVNLSS
jgi:hypothetical protein